MTSVAKWRCSGHFALAKQIVALLLCVECDWLEFGNPMRSIAEWLVLGLPTTAPPYRIPRFERNRLWCGVCDFRLGHISTPQVQPLFKFTGNYRTKNPLSVGEAVTATGDKSTIGSCQLSTASCKLNCSALLLRPQGRCFSTLR